MKPLCRGSSLEQQYFTAEELSAMIYHHVAYWADPSGKSDIEAEAANVLSRNCLRIAQQLLLLLKLGSTPLVAETDREWRTQLPFVDRLGESKRLTCT